MVRLSSWNLYMKFVMANFAIVQVDKDENLGYIFFSCFYEDYDALEILYLMANFAIVRVNKEEIGDFFFLVSMKFQIVNEYLVNLIVWDLNFSKRGGIQVVFRRFSSSP